MAIKSRVMANQYSIAQARDRFTRLVQEAESGQAAQITRRGQPVAVLLSVDAYEHLSSMQAQFGNNLEQFRVSCDIEGLEVDPDCIFDVRDKSSGRDVEL